MDLCNNSFDRTFLKASKKIADSEHKYAESRLTQKESAINSEIEANRKRFLLAVYKKNQKNHTPQQEKS